MEKITIRGVPETMLQTLYARAKESRKPDHVIYDEKAIEIADRLDYDFSRADSDKMMSQGVVARTYLLDRMVREYLDRHATAVVVNIACGLDTRYYRMNNGKLRWYNLDLPETIAVRARFLPEDGAVSQIAKSATDESWTEEIELSAAPVLVIIEGLTMYLSEADVKKMLEIIGGRFENVTVLMETMSPFAVGHIKEKSIEASKAKFSWGVKSGKEVERFAPEFRFVCDRSLVEGMKVLNPLYKLVAWIPAIRSISNKITVLEKGVSAAIDFS